MPDPTQLRALQRRMLARLTGSLASQPSDDDGSGWVRGDAVRAAATRLQAYEEMYFLRLREALAAYFPRTAAALGDDFDPTARRYLLRHPSRHPSLRQLGAELPAFLDGPMAALARLELARLDVFDGEDEPLLTRTDLAALTPDGFAALPIALVRAQRVLPCDWEVTRMFADSNDRVAERSVVLVGRRDVTVYQRRLDPLEAELLAALSTSPAPIPFADICERIAAHAGEAESAALGCALLLRWVDDQLLARFPRT
jgi:hypothetical protein